MASPNDRIIKAYIKGLEQKITRKFRGHSQKLNESSLAAALLDMLPKRQCEKCLNVKEPEELMKILAQTQEKVIDQQNDINSLKKKITLQDELTYSFFKVLMKEKNKGLIETVKSGKKEKNPFSLLVSRCEERQPEDTSLLLGSPICQMNQSRKSQMLSSTSRYGQCVTSRSKLDTSRLQSSDFATQLEMDEKQKCRALTRLRKLQKFVFEKENYERSSRMEKSKNMWNIGVSPTKRIYREENENLKAIQTNLVTHISLEIPSVEGLVAREEQLKKRERLLREKEEQVERRELELNKKHSSFLRRQKSQKIL